MVAPVCPQSARGYRLAAVQDQDEALAQASDWSRRRCSTATKAGFCTLAIVGSVALVGLLARRAPPRAAAATTSLRSHAGGPALQEKVTISMEKLEVKERLHSDACEIEDSIFFPGNDLENASDIDSPEACCSRCRRHPECLAWSWGKAWGQPNSEVCFLKGAYPRALTKVAAADFVSGQTHQREKKGAPLQVVRRAQGQSLYCFSLLQPHGYELGLVAMQYRQRASIFECDEYALYSNRTFEIVPQVWTSFVNSSLSCDMGGEFGTALNTGIFLALWSKIVFDGRFIYHDWTVKVDPDAVLLPERLRPAMLQHEETARGTYINNCKFGLHGPLEVFSRNAVKVWALGATTCVKHFTELCSGPCGWGEDMFIDQCLHRQLNVRRDNNYGLLLEDHCDPPAGWEDCANETVASFHPFKTEEGWMACLQRTREAGGEARGTTLEAGSEAREARGMNFKRKKLLQ